ncbi:hypothetical protein GCM10022420_092310 [Streptomyces iranensis]
MTAAATSGTAPARPRLTMGSRVHRTCAARVLNIFGRPAGGMGPVTYGLGLGWYGLLMEFPPKDIGGGISAHVVRCG